MTDLEMTKLCAEAMGVAVGPVPNVNGKLTYQVPLNPLWFSYDPLHDDAQAMALVKKFSLSISMPELGVWEAAEWHDVREHFTGLMSANPDLNRAIVECVAKMQEGKP